MPLTNREPWRYFHPIDEEAALTALRTRIGESYETDPDDDALLAILARCVAFLETATERFFVLRTGTLNVSGPGAARLDLPFPVPSVDQVGEDGSISEIQFDGDEDPLDPESWRVNDGAWNGPGDPRQDPHVEFLHNGTPSFGSGRTKWSSGLRNVAVTGAWGYLDEGGETPELVKDVLARLVVKNNVSLDDMDAMDARNLGPLLRESVLDRSYTYSTTAASSGLTLDRTIDQILVGLRRPPRATVFSPGAARHRNRGY